jgi:hypothetical protein
MGKYSTGTVEGGYLITFPGNLNPIGSSPGVPGLKAALDPSLPAYGYLNVVGPDVGDFYSVMVKASDPGARLRQTCPVIGRPLPRWPPRPSTSFIFYGRKIPMSTAGWS